MIGGTCFYVEKRKREQAAAIEKTPLLPKAAEEGPVYTGL